MTHAMHSPVFPGRFTLALVLVFIGSKIFIADLLDLQKFPASLSLGVTIALIVAGVLYSLHRTRRDDAAG